MGNFTPETTGMLSLLDGENANGTWVLNVSDNAGIDTGAMRRFSLIFNSGNAPEELIPAPGDVRQTDMPDPPTNWDKSEEARPQPKTDKPIEEKKPGVFEMLSNFIFGPAPEPVRVERGWSASSLPTVPTDFVSFTGKARHRPAG
jgi:hypothetical protein